MRIHELLSEQTSHKDFDDKHPELVAAAQKVYSGEMSKDEYFDLVGKHRPVKPYTELPPSASNDDLTRALKGKNQAEKINASIEPGQRVHLRLDIPAYTRHNVWAPTIHSDTNTGKIGPAISHQATAVIDNVEMFIDHSKGNQVHKKGHPINIARGEIAKYPLATIVGNWIPATVEQAREEAQIALNDPEWIQVGMDPRRHSYFYDRKTRTPVEGGERAIQIGGLIFLKNPIFGNKDDYVYEYLDQEILDELSFFGRQCTKDCSGHMAGWQWEKKKQKNIRQNTPSNSFNNGTEIATNQRSQGKANIIGPSIRGEKGKFVKYQGPQRF